MSHEEKPIRASASRRRFLKTSATVLASDTAE